MFQAPDYSEEAVSMKLSEVLADIGVDTRMVLKRRRSMLLLQSIFMQCSRLCFIKKHITCPYMMGSQAEGTTTLGLNSDTDNIYCLDMYHVIQDWSDWQPGVINLLMIQDRSVSPGYCRLQLLRHDSPLPMRYYKCKSKNSPCTIYRRDRYGRVLLKNSLICHNVMYRGPHERPERHGPAFTLECNLCEHDNVIALPCTTWPLQARQWLHQQSVGQWPTDEIKQYCCSSGCLLVGVGRHGSENEDLEWRISTSLAERCLMNNLNITQIRCYVLMKMIIKTFINPLFTDVISSYMCKTVLFHCIENTQSIIWQEKNLIVCLSLCIHDLYTNILNENCPHFFIPGNNLMRGKITPEVKPFILEILQRIINSNVVALLGIKCDDLGTRLQLKFNNISICPFRTCEDISVKLLHLIAIQLSRESTSFSYWTWGPIQALKQNISDIVSLQCHGLDKTARNLLAPRVCSRLGSVLASRNIQQYNTISAEALNWISLGLNTNVASSKLKLASMLYCTRQFGRAEIVLCDIERHYDLNIVEPFCPHHVYRLTRRQAFKAVCDQNIEEALQNATANCVQFWPCEVYCFPKELRQEMFRSTEEDKAFRTIRDSWMDHVEVDSLTFLYFLQYKIYSHLNKQEDTRLALSKLTRTIEQEPNLAHRETALNLLGQCMEQEHRPINALQYYSLSLNIRRRNNAAKIHICRLLSRLVNNQY
ncbi:uncharacterized protein LOC132756363 [Ruditapes philippinarum]|uniref:uncharacterized protein LOC132756363 n=1 Tax=Ruditapes philippinarum TaxID=129788 RepID=UPI00295BF735|nr:uncharacterized protein LOC132756363 [Ruditapes philippinarum]